MKSAAGGALSTIASRSFRKLEELAPEKAVSFREQAFKTWEELTTYAEQTVPRAEVADKLKDLLYLGQDPDWDSTGATVGWSSSWAGGGSAVVFAGGIGRTVYVALGDFFVEDLCLQ